MKLDSTTRGSIAGCGSMLGEAVYELLSARTEVLATVCLGEHAKPFRLT